MQRIFLVVSFLYFHPNVGGFDVGSELVAQLLLKSSTSGEGLEVIGNQCKSGIFFHAPERFTCTCLTGMWAFYSSWCTVPVTIIGGIDYCQELNDMQLAQVSLLTSNIDTNKPTLTRVTANVKHLNEIIDSDSNVYWNTKYSSFITSGSGLNGWTITVTTGDQFCLVHNYTSTEIPSYCFFDHIGDYKINYTQLGCSSFLNVEQINPVYCANFVVGNPSDRSACINETELGQKIKKILGLNRLKRTDKMPNYDAEEDAVSNDAVSRSGDRPIPEVIQKQSEFQQNGLDVKPELKQESEQSQTVEENELHLQLSDFVAVTSATGEGENNANLTDNQRSKEKSAESETAIPTNSGDILLPIIPDFSMIFESTTSDHSEYSTPDYFTDSTDKPPIDPFETTTSYETPLPFETTSSYESTSSFEATTTFPFESTSEPNPNCPDEYKPECDPVNPKEDELNIHSVKNNPIILNHLCSHVEIKIGEIVGTRVKVENQRKWPTVQILEQTLEIMRQTCKAIPLDYLDMALETFINVQTHSLHLKEPYISHPAFFRIQKALENCLVVATPHQFVTDNGTVGFSCENNERKPSSNQISRNGQISTLEIPEDRQAKGFEPIVETIWKVLVNTHSYCFKYFSDYFNDHHTFTVALMPYFNNEIQKIWMPAELNGTYTEPEENLQLYGGLIGDHKVILQDIDNCVAASRIGSSYPWYMNRPPKDESNKWRRKRKRRSIEVIGLEEEENQYCLKSPEDPVQLFSLQKCDQ